jgi:hypothetical protein
LLHFPALSAITAFFGTVETARAENRRPASIAKRFAARRRYPYPSVISNNPQSCKLAVASGKLSPYTVSKTEWVWIPHRKRDRSQPSGQHKN